MWFKQNTWTGTYYVYRPGKLTQLRKDPTPKMRKIMNEVEPRIERNYKIWKEVK
jgi:hypothetical protein